MPESSTATSTCENHDDQNIERQPFYRVRNAPDIGLANTNTPTVEQARYREVVRSFDGMLSHGLAVSQSLVGVEPGEPHLGFADPIFGKLLCHAISLRKLAPTSETASAEQIWDLSSSCAIARALVESFDALAYIALAAVGAEELSFRLKLWQLHDQERRHKMLSSIGSTDPKAEEIRLNAERLQEEVVAHPYFEHISGNVKQKIRAFDAPAYHLSKRELCEASFVDHGYYTAATMFLSQYVHTLPMAVNQLSEFRAGDPEATRLMSLPMQYSMAFLAKSIEGMETVFAPARVTPTPEVARSLELWRSLARSGVRRVG